MMMGLHQDGDADEAVLDRDSNATGDDEEGDMWMTMCMIMMMALVVRTVMMI